MNPVQAAHTIDLVRRARRLRRSPGIRGFVRETRLSAEQFLYPLFVCPGKNVRREVPSMPGVFQLSVDEAVREVEAARADGVPGVLLFGLPDKKDDVGSGAYDADAPVQSAVRAIKRASPDTVVVTDVCLCEYTSHGHCGVLVDRDVANDPTVDQLVRAAVSHATAGADIVAPDRSAMTLRNYSSRCGQSSGLMPAETLGRIFALLRRCHRCRRRHSARI